ncbi:DNA-binding transcriptional regulator, LacI/PurR family [Tranquillimonas rosea]|uniref:DNA-binding transcriptional regulator, LacI/PurR family n=1 Tax=Tranquillimonas rosea TaxID=641238 RepID=A0A1H9VCH1_9RHOB|nr:LacI family DNA-binding transcriptional regulator [Tranquillimonas rosea]SES19288.1 DNA-binding transcriptional regulator, LacI/PurR family [Tranquillimonas rosea]
MTIPRNAVSAKDVAEAAGVSRAAVSRTFTPGASVSPTTRAKVLAAAERLGYHVNHLARGLITAESGIVALIVAELDTPFRSRLLAALTEKLQADGKVAMLINTDRSDESVKGALRQAISYRTDAAVVLSGMPDPALGDLCIRNGLRLVLINREEGRPGALHIRLNDAACGAQAFEALRRIGCVRPAVATSRSATTSLRLRAEGFAHAAEDAGLPATREAIGVTSYAAGLDLGTALLSRSEPPDGIFCTTDLLAFGVLDVARQRFGRRVPEDLSVIGFDDVAQAGWDAYRLTTFAQPVDEISESIVSWLDGNGAADDLVELDAHLVWRDTVSMPSR